MRIMDEIETHFFLFFLPYLVEDPDLSIDSGSGHPMAIIMKENTFLFGISPQ